MWTRQWLYHVVDWCLNEIEVRAGVMVAGTRLLAYEGGRSLEETLKVGWQPAVDTDRHSA